jgi:hypothetical protein
MAKIRNGEIGVLLAIIVVGYAVTNSGIGWEGTA